MALQFITSTTLFYSLAFCITLGFLYYLALPRPLPGIPYNRHAARKILGDAPELIKHVKEHQTVSEWMRGHSERLQSPIYQLFIRPLGRPIVFVTDPRESHDAMVRRTKDFDRSKNFEDIFQGFSPHHHIYMPTNDQWRFQRRLMQDTMSNGFLYGVAAGHLHKQASILMDLWRTKSEKGQGHAFWAADDINQMALDSIWAVAFGTDINTIKTQHDFLQDALVHVPSGDGLMDFPKAELPKDFESIIYLTESLTISVQSPWPRQAHWWYRQGSGYKAAVAHRDKLVTERLEDAKRRLLSSDADDSMINCACDNMIRREQQAAEKEDREASYDSPVTRAELFGFLVAGHDTTSSTVMWGLKYLTDHPDVQGRLRAALRAAHRDNVLDETVPSADAICRADVPYLDAVIEEVLRLSSTVAMQSRRTLRDVVLLGHRVPKGTDVQFLSNGPGFLRPDPFSDRIPDQLRSPSSREAKDGRGGRWDDETVERFMPERWLVTVTDDGQKKKKKKKNNTKEEEEEEEEGGGLEAATGTATREEFDPKAGPSRPFGAGIRGCFGKKLAYLELRILFTVMVWSFELRPVPEGLASSYRAVDTLTHKPQQCYVRPVPFRHAVL